MNTKPLTPRRIKNRVLKQEEEIKQQQNQKPIDSLKITIEWIKSKTWGHCPRAQADVWFKDGTVERRAGYKAGGCGYDKESTVIAEIFNDFLLYKLYQKHSWKDRINQEDSNHPYGVDYYDGGTDKDKHDHEWYIRKPTFNGGVGTSCYFKIAEFIGGSFEHVASGNTFDVYKYSDLKKED